jgi:hypothetical protein
MRSSVRFDAVLEVLLLVLEEYAPSSEGDGTDTERIGIAVGKQHARKVVFSYDKGLFQAGKNVIEYKLRSLQVYFAIFLQHPLHEGLDYCISGSLAANTSTQTLI